MEFPPFQLGLIMFQREPTHAFFQHAGRLLLQRHPILKEMYRGSVRPIEDFQRCRQVPKRMPATSTPDPTPLTVELLRRVLNFPSSLSDSVSVSRSDAAMKHLQLGADRAQVRILS